VLVCGAEGFAGGTSVLFPYSATVITAGERKASAFAGRVSGRWTLRFTVRGGSGGGSHGGGLGMELAANRRALEWRVPYIRLLDAAGGSVRSFEEMGRTYGRTRANSSRGATGC